MWNAPAAMECQSIYIEAWAALGGREADELGSTQPSAPAQSLCHSLHVPRATCAMAVNAHESVAPFPPGWLARTPSDAFVRRAPRCARLMALGQFSSDL